MKVSSLREAKNDSSIVWYQSGKVISKIRGLSSESGRRDEQIDEIGTFYSSKSGSMAVT